MPLDPATLIARTTAGDAELSAPRHGLAIAQRRLLTLLDQPIPLEELVARPGLQPDRLERDLARLADRGLVEVHRPSGATGPMFPSVHRPAKARDQPLPVTATPMRTPTVTGNSRPMLRVPPAASPSSPPAWGRRVRRGRAMVLGAVSLVAAGAGTWYFATPSLEPVHGPSPPPAQAPVPATASPPPIRAEASTVSTAPAKAVEPVRVLLTPDPAPGRPPIVAVSTVPAAAPAPVPVPEAVPSPPPAPALVFEAPATRAASPPPPGPIAPLAIAPLAIAPLAVAPLAIAAATPVVQETRIAPLRLAPVTREVPDFPREAMQAGVSHGTVTARVTVDAAGLVTNVDIVDAQPRRVFDRAVMRSLAQWTFAPGDAGRTTDVEIAFRRE